MNYEPAPTPQKLDGALEFLARELRRISATINDSSPTVLYRTQPANQGSLTAGVSANYKIAAGNVIRISSSNTVTLTGIFDKTPSRERVLINVGTGVVTLKSDGAESSSSYRFLLPASVWNLSANASAILWYDAYSHRHRGIAKT